MSQGEGGGRPPKFGEELTVKILEGIEKVLVMRQVAGHAGVTYQSIYNWLEQGKKDIQDNNWTEFSKFFYAVKGAQSAEVQKLVKEIKARVPGWQANAWLLERCFREDFGQEAGIIQELLAQCEKIEQAFKRFNEQPQGALNG